MACQFRSSITSSPTYEAESRKQIATPKKKTANTIASATFASAHGRYLLLYAYIGKRKKRRLPIRCEWMLTEQDTTSAEVKRDQMGLGTCLIMHCEYAATRTPP